MIGRLIHSAVQCTGDNVALRGQVFTINFVAILWLMAHAAWVVVRSASNPQLQLYPVFVCVKKSAAAKPCSRGP